MEQNIVGRRIQAVINNQTIFGVIEDSSRRGSGFDGKVVYTVLLDKLVRGQWRSTGTNRVLVAEEQIIQVLPEIYC